MPAKPASKIRLGYQARPQFAAFHRRKQRWSCIVAHRRAGKTVACVMDLIDAALRCKKPDGRFSYVSPTYTQSKDTAWSYLKRFTTDIPGVEQRESDLMVLFPNGSRVRLYGADNFDRLRGTYADGMVIDEYADIDPRAWPEVLRPSLADRQGWCVFIGTPKGRNDFYKIHENARTDPAWFSLVLRADETHILPQQNLMDGINAARVSIASAWFDADKCHDGLEALRAYRADYDDKRKAFTDRPRHDWASHGADGFRYLGLAWREMQPEKPKPPPADSWSRAFERASRADVDAWRVA
jgi:hypothetical protein